MPPLAGRNPGGRRCPDGVRAQLLGQTRHSGNARSGISSDSLMASVLLEITDRDKLIFLCAFGQFDCLVIDRQSLDDHLNFQYIRDLRKEESSPELQAPAGEERGPNEPMPADIVRSLTRRELLLD